MLRRLFLFAVAAALTGMGLPVNGEPPPRPNIIFISIDTLRADHLGCYGYPRKTSPNIDALAGEGVLFTQVYATSSWTLPSHASMFTGTLPSVHGAYEADRQIRPDLPMLAECLHDAGYLTAGFVCAPLLHSSYGFARGFDHYDDYSIPLICDMDLFGNRTQGTGITEVPTSPHVVRTVRAWLDANRPSEPLFLFVHFWDCHTEYRPPEPWRSLFLKENPFPFVDSLKLTAPFYQEHKEEIVALYDGEIAFVDKHVGDLIQYLRTNGLLDDALVILTSDHGEEFFEHGSGHHGNALYRESVHVPLLFVWKGHLAHGTKQSAITSTASLMPTILDLASIPAPKKVTAPSLRSLLNRDAASAKLSGVVAISQLHKDGKWSMSLRDERWTVLMNGVSDEVEVYDMLGDATEERDLGLDSLDEDALGRYMQLFKSSISGIGAASSGDSLALPDDVKEVLSAMGYIR